MELYVPADDHAKELVVRAQEYSSLGNWYEVIEAMKLVNSILLGELIRACEFANIHGGIDYSLVNVLDVLGPGTFEPHALVFPKESFTARDVPRYLETQRDVQLGTFAQFLSYLVQEQTAGVEFKILHPSLAGYSRDLWVPSCMYVHRTAEGKRRLGLANLDWARTNSSWRIFAVAKQAT